MSREAIRFRSLTTKSSNGGHPVGFGVVALDIAGVPYSVRCSQLPSLSRRSPGDQHPGTVAHETLASVGGTFAIDTTRPDGEGTIAKERLAP